jgi:tripartite-type tricarboxylate transporter receptor subunit TctC
MTRAAEWQDVPNWWSRATRIALTAVLGVITTPALSQAPYPAQSIRFIVPYAAGGLPDVVMRQIGARLSERLQQGMIVENRPGAGGVSAAQALLSSPADGYTFIFSDAAMVSISPLILKSIPYDPRSDLVPVSYAARAPNFIAVHPSVPATTFAEFVALAKARPGKVTCGSSGVGSLHHLTLEIMKNSLGIDLVHVPFRGSGQSVPAMLGGQIDCLLASLAPLAGIAANGKVRILAFAGTHPSAVAPDIKPIGDAMKGFDSAFVLGVLAKKGVSDEIAQKLSKEIAAVVKEPEIEKGFAKLGVESVGVGPKEYGEALRLDAEQMAQAVRIGKIKLD